AIKSPDQSVCTSHQISFLGLDLTKVPFALKRSIKPSASNKSSACRIVIVATPHSFDNASTVGILEFTGHCPVSILCLNIVANCKYIATELLRRASTVSRPLITPPNNCDCKLLET